MRRYILYGPGNRDPNQIINQFPNVYFQLLHEPSDFFNLSKNFIIIVQYIYRIPKELLIECSLVYCYVNRKTFEVSNKEILEMFFAKYNHIKSFIGT